MPTAFDALTEKQKTGFRSQVARLGLEEGFYSHDGVLDTGRRSGPTILSTNPAESHVPPKLIPVATIADFKRLCGVPDTDYTERKFSERAIRYPPELAGERAAALGRITDVVELTQSMTVEELQSLQLAGEAYVLGNSARVMSYEPLLNAFYYPGHVAAFVLDSIMVQAGSPLLLTSPDPNGSATLVAATITVNAGAQIQVQCKAGVSTQTFTAL